MHGYISIQEIEGRLKLKISHLSGLLHSLNKYGELVRDRRGLGCV